MSWLTIIRSDGQRLHGVLIEQVIRMQRIQLLQQFTDSTHIGKMVFCGKLNEPIDCIVIEDEYGNTPAQRAELDWLLI